MSFELAPRARDPRPPPLLAGQVARAAGVALAAAALFWSPLCLGGALRAEDWSSHHFHYFDWVRTSLVGHGTLPLYMADAWVTPNFLANAESPSLGPLVWLLAFLPTDAYIKWLIVAHTSVGLLGAALGSGRALVGAVDAAALLSGQHQPFVWQNGLLAAFAALWALRARALFPLSRAAQVALLAAGLGAVKLLPMILLLAWLRRGRRDPASLGTTLGASFALLYGTTSYFAFQYLAWSLPFWFFVDARIAAAVTLLLAAYVYGVYALFTGSPLLLGRWDFVRHAAWPPLLTWLRDASIAACLLVGWGTLARTALKRPERMRTTSAPSGSDPALWVATLGLAPSRRSPGESAGSRCSTARSSGSLSRS